MIHPMSSVNVYSQIWVLEVIEEVIPNTNGKLKYKEGILHGRVPMNDRIFNLISETIGDVPCCEMKKGATLKRAKAFLDSVDKDGYAKMRVIEEPKDF